MGGILIGFFFIIFYIYILPRKSGGAREDNPSGAALRNGHSAAAKCINEGAQKEKKLAPI